MTEDNYGVTVETTGGTHVVMADGSLPSEAEAVHHVRSAIHRGETLYGIVSDPETESHPIRFNAAQVVAVWCHS